MKMETANSKTQQYVSILLPLISASILNIFGATLEPVIDKATGRRAYSDYWGPTPIREINTKEDVNLIGTTLALLEGGTNVEVRFILALISPGTNDFPRRINGSISAQVRSSTNELNNKNLLGQLDGSIVFNPERAEYRPIKVFKHSSESLDGAGMLFVYELRFEIPLRKKVAVIPEYFSILASFPAELNFWRYTRMPIPPEERPSSLPLLTATVPIPAKQIPPKPSSTKQRENIEPVARERIAATGMKQPASEIRVSITREKSFLLVTCSPVVDGALLEEADLNSSVLEWRPLQNGSNHQSRWYVPPDDGARAFRVKLPQ